MSQVNDLVEELVGDFRCLLLQYPGFAPETIMARYDDLIQRQTDFADLRDRLHDLVMAMPSIAHLDPADDIREEKSTVDPYAAEAVEDARIDLYNMGDIEFLQLSLTDQNAEASYASFDEFDAIGEGYHRLPSSPSRSIDITPTHAAIVPDDNNVATTTNLSKRKSRNRKKKRAVDVEPETQIPLVDEFAGLTKTQIKNRKRAIRMHEARVEEEKRKALEIQLHFPELKDQLPRSSHLDASDIEMKEAFESAVSARDIVEINESAAARSPPRLNPDNTASRSSTSTKKRQSPRKKTLNVQSSFITSHVRNQIKKMLNERYLSALRRQ